MYLFLVIGGGFLVFENKESTNNYYYWKNHPCLSLVLIPLNRLLIRCKLSEINLIFYRSFALSAR